MNQKRKRPKMRYLGRDKFGYRYFVILYSRDNGPVYRTLDGSRLSWVCWYSDFSWAVSYFNLGFVKEEEVKKCSTCVTQICPYSENFEDALWKWRGDPEAKECWTGIL